MFVESFIFEGLAELFAMQVTGRQKISLYSSALTPEQKEIFLKKAKEVWLLLSYDNDLWFFGSEPEKIPRWAGYTLGYDLVEKYLKAHTDTSASKLVTADASLFIS